MDFGGKDGVRGESIGEAAVEEDWDRLNLGDESLGVGGGLLEVDEFFLEKRPIVEICCKNL